MPIASPKSSAATGRGTWILLWLLVLAGLALRVWFGSWGLNHSRYWDERYSLMNVRAAYVTGELVPVNAYYPSPVFWLPQVALLKASAALHSRTSNQAYQVLDAKLRFTATGFLLCRLVQAAYGAAAIVFVFLVGRAMFSSRIGLLAALFVAFSPWPLHASGYIKPDSLLLMTIALSFYASLAAVERPTVGRHALAGLTIALAMSSKLTGGMIALCLVLATLVLGWRDRRRFLLLAVAGASSALSFVALNPYWRYYLGFLEGLKRDYLLRAELSGSTRGAMPAQVLGFITGGYLHGIVIGGLSLAGLAWLAARACRSGGASGLERAKYGMFVIFPLVYSAIYVVQTPYFKANNFLPLVPFTAVSAAWMLAGGYGWMARRWPALGRPGVVAAGFLLLAGWQASRGWVYCYRSATPSTRDAALDFLERRLRPLNARLIHVEGWDQPKPEWGMARGFGRHLAAAKQAESLDLLPPQELALSDGLVFHQHRLEGEKAAFYQGLIAGLPGHRIRRFRPEPFEWRGPAFVAVLMDPERLEPILDLDPRACDSGPASGGACLTMSLPADPDPAAAYNLYLFLTHEALGSAGGAPSVELGERAIELIQVSAQRHGKLFLTPRFRLDGSVEEIRLRRAAAFEDPLRAQLFRWSVGSPPGRNP